ncbi:MAG: hypothetical protein KDD64_06185 [Bdellovibrionales bacterium]|nr:hypothetical protein [Bdellovibrionales bacterium]
MFGSTQESSSRGERGPEQPPELTPAPTLGGGAPGLSEPSVSERLDQTLANESLPAVSPEAQHFFEFQIEDVIIRVEPGLKESLEQFLQSPERRQGDIAIDGRVAKGTRWFPEKLILNVNHFDVSDEEEGQIPREAIGASCEQMLRMLDHGYIRYICSALERINRENSSESNGEPVEKLRLRILVEDFDQDVGWTIATVIAHMKYSGNSHILRRLREGVNYAGILDAHNGRLPTDFVNSQDEDKILQMLRMTVWVSEPYQEKRARVREMGAEEMAHALNDQVNRILQYVTAEDDEGKLWTQVKIPANFDLIGTAFPGMKILPEGYTFSANEEQCARIQLASSGVKRLLTLRGVREGNGALDVSFAALGADADFPTSRFCHWMNALERAFAKRMPDSSELKVKIVKGKNDWGIHGESSGGSPRKSGSGLPLELLILGANTFFRTIDSEPQNGNTVNGHDGNGNGHKKSRKSEKGESSSLSEDYRKPIPLTAEGAERVLQEYDRLLDSLSGPEEAGSDKAGKRVKKKPSLKKSAKKKPSKKKSDEETSRDEPV